MTTTSNVGIWIDHRRALVVFAAPDQITTRTVTSGVGAHPHFGGSQVGGGEKKYEERFNHELARFYDAVLDEIGQPASVLILGPGEAKHQLAARFDRSAARAAVIALEAADTLSEPQVIAKVKQHFEL